MKLFSKRPTWADLTRADADLSGITSASVQMNQIAFLNKFISQLSTMKSLKPNDEKMTNAIDVLMACKSEINNAIQRPVNKLSQVEQNEPSTSEGPSFNRRP